MEQIFTDANFSTEVLSSKTPVLVDFWAEWCGPCQMMGPIVEELAEELVSQNVKIGKMNVDQNSVTPGTYRVFSIPTFLLFKNGKVVDQWVGIMEKGVMKERVLSYV